MIQNGEYNSANFENNPVYHDYVVKSYTPMVGASVAIFGVLTAFAILFPNTEFRIYFFDSSKSKIFCRVLPFVGDLSSLSK